MAEGTRKNKRRFLVILLIVLLLLCAAVGALLVRYLISPAPLPELVALPGNVFSKPHYLFSIGKVDQPVSVALSPDDQRIYVAEIGGHRLVKVFDRDGNAITSFAIPATRVGSRSPTYLTVDKTGRVFVADRIQAGVYAYTSDGQFIDEIIAPDLTLSEYVSKHVGGLQPGSTFSYDALSNEVHYQLPGGQDQTLPRPDSGAWNPLGVRFDKDGNLLITDVLAEAQRVRRIGADVLSAPSWQEFDPPEFAFGQEGGKRGEFRFPNVAVTDSRGRIYVSDGNNGRISVWDGNGAFLLQFGKEAGKAAVGLPRGLHVDAQDRLYVVDTVNQNVKVFDVAGDTPKFLDVFGGYGIGDGRFNYPNDVTTDSSGRVYIADRENNRIQVWSY